MPNRGEPEGPFGESALNLEASMPQEGPLGESAVNLEASMPQRGEPEGAPRQSAVNGKAPTCQTAVNLKAPSAKAR